MRPRFPAFFNMHNTLTLICSEEPILLDVYLLESLLPECIATIVLDFEPPNYRKGQGPPVTRFDYLYLEASGQWRRFRATVRASVQPPGYTVVQSKAWRCPRLNRWKGLVHYVERTLLTPDLLVERVAMSPDPAVRALFPRLISYFNTLQAQEPYRVAATIC